MPQRYKYHIGIAKFIFSHIMYNAKCIIFGGLYFCHAFEITYGLALVLIAQSRCCFSEVCKGNIKIGGCGYPAFGKSATKSESSLPDVRGLDCLV
jgi:hypothetical protein